MTHDSEAHDSEVPTVGTVSQEDSDPRPVFAGDWGKADGKTRQAHLVKVNAWKRRNEQKPQTRMDTRSEQAERHADNLATLRAIQASSKSLASDRIRAVEAEQRILLREAEEERQREHGPLIDLRLALELIPPHERVAALGELLGVE